MAALEAQLRRAKIDKEILEMDRAREVLSYQRKLEEAAKQSGQSSKSVVTQGVSSRSNFGPFSSFFLAVMEILGSAEESDKEEDEDE